MAQRRRVFARIQARASAIEERRGGADRRRQLLRGLSGRVVEVGVGSGVSFAYYPGAVTELIAIEPEPALRERAEHATSAASVPVRVLDGVAERLPLADASVDAVVFAGVLCSVGDPRRVLGEARRVLRPEGELRFYEHVIARNPRLRGLQRLLDATFWPRLFGGCQTTRDTESTLAACGFIVEERERFSFRPTLLATPVAPRILGRARRGAVV
ncbi:MAG TPA: methyltransferase domain-containing protein [Solirubrobacteraceae bacterium]|nr:methyltransferase domain-containing protein [Solirubrobacteraceae bacterium]